MISNFLRYFSVLFLVLFLLQACKVATISSSSPQTDQVENNNEASLDNTAPSTVIINGQYNIQANQTSPLGTNTGQNRDWKPSLPFIDLFKTARHFSIQNPNQKFDENGWPTDLKGDKARALMLTGITSGSVPSGNYTVLYDGDGKLSYNGIGNLVSHTPGKDIVSIQPSGGIFYLAIEETNPANHIHNIRVLLPGGVCASDIATRVDTATACVGDYLSFEDHHEELMFNPDYLDFMKDFKSIRFMDMMDTNNSEAEEWSDLARFNDAVWSSSMGRIGIPVEVMVKLANTINADPWFTLPHKANDDYVRRFATYVRDHLKPELKAYIEYSNEVWNGQFKQYSYALTQGKAQGLSDGYAAEHYFYAKRSVEIFDIWESVFGGTDRLYRILASQSVNSWRSGEILAYKDAHKKADALATAPYFSNHPAPIEELRAARNLDDIFKILGDNFNAAIEQMEEQKVVASQYGLDFVAYEAGQHLVDWTSPSNDAHPTPLLIGANRDPRMGEFYQRYLQKWKESGGQLMALFSLPGEYTKYGSWGMKEYLNQPASETHKYNAVIDFINNNPKWW